MSGSSCLIHYGSINTAKHLTKVSETSFQTLLECKNIRQSLGGENSHDEQCNGIPATLDDRELYYHRECYQKFTYAKALLKRKKCQDLDNNDSKKAQRVSRAGSSAAGSVERELFPNRCMICKKDNLKIKQKRQALTKIITKSAENTLKQAAQSRNDQEMLIAVQGIDLIAKEFQRHEYCYREYTRVLWEKEKKSDVAVEGLGDFQAVCELVDNNIIAKRECLSMETLLFAYGIGVGVRQRRHALKERLNNKYGDRLLFISIDYHTAQVVISRECLQTQTISKSLQFTNEQTVKRAAVILREIVLEFVEHSAPLPWPPSVDSLMSDERKCPALLQRFFKVLLSVPDSHHSATETKDRLCDSFSQDVVYAVSRGNFITSKHATVGLALHSLTGQKLPLKVLSRLGHCISYDKISEIETAQAELAQQFESMSLSLPLLPADAESKVSTIFWWDNFDKNVETMSGSGSIHNTPGIAFQEVSEQTVARKEDISIPRSKRRSLQLVANTSVPTEIKINPKTNPPTFDGHICAEHKENADLIAKKLLIIWKIVRHRSDEDQIHPRFVGWIICMFQKSLSPATVMTYLPPIQTPITEYETIVQVFKVSRELAKKSNMKYVHITFDVGAAIKSYHVIWNNPTAWLDIIVHLGDFHAMMAFFGVIGVFVEGSGFEDILFQAGLCSSGSIKGLISGKHYNRCWLLHEAFSEALERLFIQQYLPDAPIIIQEFSQDQPAFSDVSPLLTDEQVTEYEVFYAEQKRKCLDGEFGKTPQFWGFYMKLVERQQMLHYAINSNDFDLRLQMWRQSLPFCFATNRIHYSRYGSYYVKSLEYLDSTHPGAKAEMEHSGVSVKRNNHGIGQAIDLAGEQSYMKNAKTAGGVKSFATNESTVCKWVMNRPFQARFVESLIEMTGMTKTTSNPRKCLRPTEVLKSNKMVKNIMDTITTQFIDPFDTELDESELYNLVSGCPVAHDISDSLLTLEERGEEMFCKFEKRMTDSKSTQQFFDTIPKSKYKTFRNSAVRAKVKKDEKRMEIIFQRDILGKLVALSHKHNAGVDLDSVLAYPLAPVCIPLSTPDGAIRKTAKSKLFDAAMSDLTIVCFEDLPPPDMMQIYLLDLAAAVRTIVGTVTTIRDLTWKIVASIPKQYKIVYLLCDTYMAKSIKKGERKARGESVRYVLNSPDMKIPYEFANFMRNGDNKEMLFNLIEQAIEEGRRELGDRIVYFSNKAECKKITQHEVAVCNELVSDHEEADTKLVAFVRASSVQPGQSVMVRSPSGDVDILALFLGHDFPDIQILIDNGHGKSRKIIDVTSSTLSTKQRKALLGMHAFSGNDYVSSFFRKGKLIVWKVLIKNNAFVELFSSLGDQISLKEELEQGLERFVCHLYGFPRLTTVDEARRKVFWQKFNKEKKIVDLSLLPPCQRNLRYHIMRANYVAFLFRQADQLMLRLDSPEMYGWDTDRNVVWIDSCYPDDVSQLLQDEETDDNARDDDYEDDLDIELEDTSDF